MIKTPPPTSAASGGEAEILAMLEGIALLTPLTSEQKYFLAGKTRLHTYAKGQQIFEEGEKAAGFHILLHGLVKIYHISLDGKELVLRLVRPGNSFGEVPVFKGGSWPAAAGAVTASSTLFVPTQDFLKLVHDNADLGLSMLRILSQRLYMFTRKLEAQTGRDAPQRLAAYLMHRSRLENNADTISLEAPRETLANMLGTARETLSRGLTRLADVGAIEVQGRTVLLRDMELLQNIAEGNADYEDF